MSTLFTVPSRTRALLTDYAARYERRQFLADDPSMFMHRVEGRENRETMAFLAASLSYGSRRQFLPRIQLLLDWSGGDVYRWVASGAFEHSVAPSDDCFYRLYTYRTMNGFLRILQRLLADYGSLGDFARRTVAVSHLPADGGGVSAAGNAPPMPAALGVLTALGGYFRERGLVGVVPSPVSSLCKRPVMFLRWMVRDGSPVDLGLWAGFIDKRTLYIPVDTHVLRMARSLGLLSARSAGWRTVVELTDRMRTVFPDDPAKGDFALFGYGIAHP